MSLPNELLPVGLLGTGAAGGYQIQRSLRFNSSDSAYLSRTPASAGNRKTWTWAGWVKRSSLGEQILFYRYPSEGNGSGVAFGSDDSLRLSNFTNSTLNYAIITTAVYRDPSAWYHIVATIDTTQATDNNRIRLYVNGVEITTFSTRINPSQNFEGYVNEASLHTIARREYAPSYAYFSGYLADIHFIDGQALDPTSFGEFDTNGIWQPIEYQGEYGTNGFHLPFSDNSTASALGTDTSGNGNTWTVNNILAGGTVNYSNDLSSNLSLVSPTSAFDGSLSTLASTPLTNDGYILFTPTSPITYSSSVRFYAYAANGYSITNYYSINGGSEVTFVGGGAGYNGPAWITAASGSGTLTSLKVRLTRSPDQSAPGLYAIEIDGNILLDLSSAGNDSLVDSPTSYGIDDGLGGSVRGNYCTWNPLNNPPTSATLANGNLEVTANTTLFQAVTGTIFASSGKWYAEFLMQTTATDQVVGIAANTFVPSSAGNRYIGRTADSYGFYSDGRKIYNNTFSAYGTSWIVGDILQVALDLDNGKVWLGKNGTWQASGDPAAGTNAAFTGISGLYTFACSPYGTGKFFLNTGQRPFAYTAPEGFKSLCTTNLPEPTIADGSTAMDVALYTGNGSTQTISGLGFSPDLVWIKNRNTAYDHELYDTVRGVTNRLMSSFTGAEDVRSGVTAFNSDGFSLGSAIGANTNSSPHVAWTWDAGTSTVTNTDGTITSQVRANPSAGFSVVTVNSTTIGTIGHGLGVKPAMIIEKCRGTTSNWYVRHQSLGDMKSSYLRLNLTNAAVIPGDTTAWNNTEPTSTTISINNNYLYANGSVVYYCFAPVAGYSAFGSYTGQGSSSGPFIYTGFKPKWLLIKGTNAAYTWYVFDAERDPFNGVDAFLNPNNALAESTAGGQLYDFLSNGFRLISGNGELNANGSNYVYAAFAETPFSLARAR